MEYIYPTDYEVNHALTSQMDGTNIVYGTDSAGAAVEPQSFTMRETGTIVQTTPSLTADGNFIDIELYTYLVGEPEWKDYGAKAKWKGTATVKGLFARCCWRARENYAAMHVKNMV